MTLSTWPVVAWRKPSARSGTGSAQTGHRKFRDDSRKACGAGGREYGQDSATMKTIVVPLDLSAAATQVCKAACDLARRTGAGLRLVYVVQPPFVVGDLYGMEGSYIQEAVAAATQAGKQRLKALARTCAKRGLRVRTFEGFGDPAVEILRQARRAAFIVIGSHGHGAMFDLLVGSTTQGVLKRARCPVLVVPVREGRG
jgi:nucleotide-binding universal stress UspA family protein